jgi:tape measure domain-containing protein
MATRFTIESVFKAVDNLSAPVAKMQQKINRMTSGINSNLKNMNGVLGKVASSIGSVAKTAVKAGVVGIGALATATTLFLREFSKIEDAEASFTPLLGGAEKAKKMVESLNKTAASTPFQFEDLANTANQLLPVMNGNIEDTIKSIRMLGDTSGGNAEKLKSITAGYTKAMLKGKVDLESLNMIGEAGVPIFQELAKTMNTKVGDKFFKMISDGDVKTKDLTKTFENMTKKNGIFFEGMEISSRTLSGVWSTLKDNISLAAADIGSVMAPIVKDLLKKIIDTTGSIREWVKANKELISIKFDKFVDTVKSSVERLITGLSDLNSNYSIIDRLIDGIKMIGDAVSFLSDHGKTIAIFGGTILALSVVLNTFIGVMTAVNLVMAINPIGLIIIGVGLLVGAFVWLMAKIDDVEDYFDGLGETARNVLAPIRLLIDALQTAKEWGGKALEFLGFKAPDIKLPSFVGVGANNSKSSISGSNQQMISPQDRVSKQIQETTNNNNSKVEVTIKDETGKAKITKNETGNKVKLQPTGAF